MLLDDLVDDCLELRPFRLVDDVGVVLCATIGMFVGTTTTSKP